MINIKRRAFILALGGTAMWPLVAQAQQGERMRRIGVIMAMREKDAQARLNLEAFRQGLKALGLEDGLNVRIDYRFGANEPDLIRAAAAEILALAPDAILTHGTAVTTGVSHQTRTVPVVFTVVSDPVGSGFVESFARPGGNLTGFTNFLEPSFAAKWIELLNEIVPGIRRIAIMFNPQPRSGGGLYFVEPAEAAAVSLGKQPVRMPVQSAADVERALEVFAREPGGGLVTPPDTATNLHRGLIVSLAARYRLPGVHPYRFYLTSGGLMSYGMNYADVFRRAAAYVDRILRGDKPGELPVQAPTKFELVINMATAKALGIEVPPALLARADEVIE
jgi:putative tryptophan/tyrosine transport system substrate-binding protein